MVGADVAALRQFATALRNRRDEIENARHRVATTVETLSWSGPDHDSFLGAWRDQHLPRIDALVAELDQVASNASYRARLQEQASGSW